MANNNDTQQIADDPISNFNHSMGGVNNEPLRRMCQWRVNEMSDPQTDTPLWSGAKIVGNG